MYTNYTHFQHITKKHTSCIDLAEPSTPDSIAEESEEEKDEVFPLRSVTVETKTPVVNQDAKVLPVRKTEPGLGGNKIKTTDNAMLQ